MDQDLTVVVISDTHNNHPDKLPAGDILIHCGDMTDHGTEAEIRAFIKWLNKQDFKYKIVIGGNHDFILDREAYPKLKQQKRLPNDNQEEVIQMLKQCCIYLCNEAIVIEGYKIWGSPYSLEYSHSETAFKVRKVESIQFWSQVPDQTEILLTHGPPYGIGDSTSIFNKAGDKGLLQRVYELKPLYHLFGHIHQGYGQWNKNGIHFANCAMPRKGFWRSQNQPQVIKLKRKI